LHEKDRKNGEEEDEAASSKVQPPAEVRDVQSQGPQLADLPEGVTMRVLVACEFSGVVRDAFRDLGHDAVSCDLLPSERPGPRGRSCGR